MDTLSTKDNLRRRAEIVRDETQDLANTAERVGQLLVDMIEGGSTLEIIESTEPVEKATEKNLFSALASLAHFLRRDAPDQTSHLLKLLGGVITDNITSQGFTEGALGSGMTLRRDPVTGKSYMEVDELFVRMKAIFKELVIQKLSHVGGEIILSPASMSCIRVEELTDRYRCFFDKTDGEKEINNEFVVNDQARCQTFNVKEGVNINVSNSYYWRLVIGIGNDYIDLSKTDCDTGSTVPQSGDDIVQLGNRTDPDRQSAQILSSYGSDAPSYKQYSGINSYSLKGKYITGFTSKGNKISGLLDIEAGSTGWENLVGLPEEILAAIDSVKVGGVNLLLNTSFEGDFESVDMENNSLRSDSEMFSPSIAFWKAEGEFINDGSSVSGKSFNGTSLKQTISRLINGEKYIISMKAKGLNVTIHIGSFNVSVTLTDEYEEYSYKFNALEAESVEFSGSFTICEIQLERGTVRTSWSYSPFDNDKAMAKFESQQYIFTAIKGLTKVLGGLVLTSMVQLGAYKDETLEKVTAGISGLYNDDDDVAVWAGGSLEDAIHAVMNPYEKTGANAVLTHGGLAILNKAIVRGTIFAEDGEFNGTVNAHDGKFRGSLATKYNELPPGDIALDFSTGFNFAGKEEFSFSDQPIVNNKNIILPSSIDYDGVQCTIINAGDTLTSRIFTVKHDHLVYPSAFYVHNKVDSVCLRGFSVVRLSAFVVNNTLKWIINNYNDFSYSFYNKTLTSALINNPLMRICSSWHFQIVGEEGSQAFFVTSDVNADGNNLRQEKLDTGRHRCIFEHPRISGYSVLITCLGRGFSYISEQTDEYFIVDTETPEGRKDIEFSIMIVEAKK